MTRKNHDKSLFWPLEGRKLETKCRSVVQETSDRTVNLTTDFMPHVSLFRDKLFPPTAFPLNLRRAQVIAITFSSAKTLHIYKYILTMTSRHPEMYRLNLSSHQTDGPLKRHHQIYVTIPKVRYRCAERHVTCNDVTPVITRSSCLAAFIEIF